MVEDSNMSPLAQKLKLEKLYKIVRNGDFMELDEAGSESEPEDTWNDQKYAKEKEEDLIYALKELWDSACKQKLPVKDNLGDFYLVWFTCVEEPSNDCIFDCKLIDQCTLNTQNNNWKSGAHRKQSSREQTLHSVPFTAVSLNTGLKRKGSLIGKRPHEDRDDDKKLEKGVKQNSQLGVFAEFPSGRSGRRGGATGGN